MKTSTIEIEFVPQAWVNDYAVRADPEGPTTWKVSKRLLKGIKPDTNKSDELRFHKNAPKWVKDWSGPFYVTWDEDDLS